MGTAYLYSGSYSANVNFKFAGSTALFFGDSLAAGYMNDDVSYVDYISQMGIFGKVTKHAVAGSGYSTYGGIVTGSSLEDFITTYADEISTADFIFLQYGNNDGVAVAYGSITLDQVKAKAESAIEAIFALNPTARVSLITVYNDPYRLASGTDSVYAMAGTAKRVANHLSRKYNLPIISMLDDASMNSINSGSFLASDGIHYNDDGHKAIASLIARRINVQSDTVFTHTLDYSTTLYQQLSFIKRYMECGGQLYVLIPYGDGYVKAQCVFYGETSALFSAPADSGAGVGMITTLAMNASGQIIYRHTLQSTVATV